MPSPATYNTVAKFLHWTIALAIIGMLALGWIMTDLPRADPMRFTLVQAHKSVGITILLLALFRLGWRWAHPAPPLPEAMPKWEKFLAATIVLMFYLLMIGMPMTGWVIVSTSPFNLPTILYGFIPWPHLPVLPELENKKEIGHAVGDIHGLLAYVMAGALFFHLAGALKHHFINRDNVLLRMSPACLGNFLNRLRR